MAEYKISDDGTIVYEDRVSLSSEKTPEEEMYAEYNKLVYDVIDHPERFTTAEIPHIVAEGTELLPDPDEGLRILYDRPDLPLAAQLPHHGHGDLQLLRGFLQG